jgi:hypothetical protein
LTNEFEGFTEAEKIQTTGKRATKSITIASRRRKNKPKRRCPEIERLPTEVVKRPLAILDIL